MRKNKAKITACLISLVLVLTDIMPTGFTVSANELEQKGIDINETDFNGESTYAKGDIINDDEEIESGDSQQGEGNTKEEETDEEKTKDGKNGTEEENNTGESDSENVDNIEEIPDGDEIEDEAQAEEDVTEAEAEENIDEEETEQLNIMETTTEDMAAVEASGTCGDNLTWTLADGTLTISGTGDMYYSSRMPWGEYRDFIKTLVIEKGITSIGFGAFKGCDNITGSLIIPDSVKEIRLDAFNGCSGFTGSLTIPDSVTEIGDRAFEGCSGFNGSLTIPDSVTSIGNYAFEGCSGFTGSLSIPNSVASIGYSAFYGCSSFTGSLIIPDSITSIEFRAFGECKGFTGSLIIPDSVTSIDGHAFYNCSGFTGSLIIPNSVTSIGEWAFFNCSGFKGNLTLPDSVTSIGEEAFYDCEGFTGSLMIPDSVTSMGKLAFSGCNGFTGTLTISKNLASIAYKAFSGCDGFTGSLIIPGNVTSIGQEAFRDCSGFTGSLTISNSVTGIGYKAFSGCSGFMGKLIISDNVTIIDSCAFEGCSGFTGSLIIPGSVTTIESGAFWDCSSFTGSLTIPDSVTSIGGNAFEGCSGLTGSLNLGRNVEYIGTHAFVDCGFRGNLTIGGRLAELNRNIFETYDTEAPHFSGTLTINEGTTTIGDNFFKDMPFTGELSLPGSITSIGSGAFQNAQFTGDLNIPDSVTELGGGAYYNSGFTGKLYLNENITLLKEDSSGHGMFEKCGFTGKIVIPDHMEDIGNAFRYCERITELSLPSHVAENAVFTGCTRLKKVEITDSSSGSIEKINDYMFDGCTSLENISFPNSVETIGKYAFRNCGFQQLDFLNTVSVIDDYAFQGCSSARIIVLSKSIEKIGNGTFKDCEGLHIIQAECSIDALQKQPYVTSFNADGITVIYADEQPAWTVITDGTYGITNAIVISYSEYINSDGESPSEISVAQNYYGFCAINSSTGKVIREAYITVDSITYKSNLEGIVLIKGTVESVQRIVSANAINYYSSGIQYCTTKLGTLTCIELDPIENAEDKTGDDIIVGSDQFAIYAVDKKTGKIIQDVTIEVDGEEYKPRDGVLYINVNSEDTNKHKVLVTSWGYLLMPYDYVTFTGGGKLEVKLEFYGKLDISYVYGVLTDLNDKTAWIDGTPYIVTDSVDITEAGKLKNQQVICTLSEGRVIKLEFNENYNISYISGMLTDLTYNSILVNSIEINVMDNFDITEAEKLKNQRVICTLRDGKVKKIEAVSDCLVANVSISPEYKESFDFVYQNGHYSKNSMGVKITVTCGLVSEYPSDLYITGNPSIDISEIRLRLDDNYSNFEILNPPKTWDDSYTINYNNNLAYGDTYSFTTDIRLKSDKAPTQISDIENLIAETYCNNRQFKAIRRLTISNADLKQSEVEEKKKKNSEEKGTPTKSDIYNTLQSNLIFNLYSFESYFGMTTEQVKAINELLTLWVANIDATTDTARKISNDEQFVKDVLGKFGVNIDPKFGISKTTAQIKIKVNTEKYGDRTFCFVLDMQNYHWDDESPFARFGTVDWYIEETKDIPLPYRSGNFGMIAKADTGKFINQLRDLSMDSIQSAYDSFWGKKANKVAQEILDKRILALIKEKYDNTSNMIFKLLLDATKDSVNSKNRTITRTKCPVDLYIYDSFGDLAGSIIDNVAYPADDGILVYMDGEEKVAVYCADEYTIKFVGTGTGTMQHEIYEYRDSENEYVRYLEFRDVPLEKGKIYYEYIPDRLFANSEVYELEEENGEIILPDTDTHTSEDLIFVKGILIEPHTLSMKVGDVQTLKPIIEPENASTQFVRWESDDDNIATVDEEGNVVAISEGNVIISVTSVDGGFNAECVITIGNQSGGTTDPGEGDGKETLPSPTANIESGSTVEKGTEISLTCSEEDVQIYYTFDETIPTEESTLYTVPIIINTDTTIKAIAAKPGYKNSEIATFNYKIKGSATGDKEDGGEDNGEILPDDMPSDGNIPTGIWSAGIIDIVYTGSNIAQSFRLYDGNKRLQEKVDYTVSYKNNKNAYTYDEKDYADFESNLQKTGRAVKYGTFDPNKAPQVIIKMKGNYSGSRTVYYQIEPRSIGGDGFASGDLWATYSGKKQTTAPILIWSGKTLKYGTDFSVPEYDAAKDDANAFKDPGTYELTIEGKKNFKGTRSITLTISNSKNQIAMNSVTVKGVKDQAWTGNKITPESYTVTYKSKALTSGEDGDYTVSWGENTSVGTGTMILTGTGRENADGYSYIGTKTVSFKITGTAMSKVTVDGVNKSYTYTGGAIEPSAMLTYKVNKNAVPVTLKKDTHYTVAYQKNQDKGTATIIFTGLESGGFTGTKKKTFKIAASGIGKEEDQFRMTFKDAENVREGIYVAPYMKGGAKPEVILTSGDKTLVLGRDYTVSYANDKKVALSTAKKAPVITVKGKGNYSGSKKVTFTIAAKSLSEENGITVAAKDKVASTKKNGYRQGFTVYDADGKKLGSSDYDTKTVTYTLIQTTDEDGTVKGVNEPLDKNSVVPAGSVIRITVEGKDKGNYVGGSVTGTYRILEKGHKISKATIQISNQTYTGQPVTITDQSQFKPNKVYIKIGNEKKVLVLGEDIEVVPGSYVKNVNKGTAKVTFRGINDFGGTKTVSYKIGTRSIADFWKGVFSKITGLMACIEIPYVLPEQNVRIA